jgi:NADH-quinone oxidoreductase subunit F
MGYAVTVFDSLPEAGGMLRWGIPEYRLPRKVIRREIQDILDLGVELKLNTKVGREISWDELRNGFDAVYLAIGAQRSAGADLDGGDLQGVCGAVEFLRDLNLGRSALAGERIAVIGGGNSAVDASRSALRLGAKKVTLVYRRRREEMPAQEEEIRAAEEEGVEMRVLSAPLRVEGANGRVKSLVCRPMELGDFDAGGRRRPVPGQGQEFSLDVEQVILAIGQEVDFPSDSGTAGIALSKSRLIEVRKGTRTETGAAMIFAGGDAVSGPDTVVGAIAAGHQAALEIDASICRRSGAVPWASEPESISVPMTVEEEIHEAPRACMSEADCADRIRDFREVELGLSAGDALKEAQRCLRCDVQAS